MITTPEQYFAYARLLRRALSATSSPEHTLDWAFSAAPLPAWATLPAPCVARIAWFLLDDVDGGGASEDLFAFAATCTRFRALLTQQLGQTRVLIEKRIARHRDSVALRDAYAAQAVVYERRARQRRFRDRCCCPCLEHDQRDSIEIALCFGGILVAPQLVMGIVGLVYFNVVVGEGACHSMRVAIDVTCALFLLACVALLVFHFSHIRNDTAFVFALSLALVLCAANMAASSAALVLVADCTSLAIQGKAFAAVALVVALLYFLLACTASCLERHTRVKFARLYCRCCF